MTLRHLKGQPVLWTSIEAFLQMDWQVQTSCVSPISLKSDTWEDVFTTRICLLMTGFDALEWEDAGCQKRSTQEVLVIVLGCHV